MDVVLPRINNKPSLVASFHHKNETSNTDIIEADDDSKYATLIPGGILIPKFKKRTLNPIKIKDIYLSKKREQFYREQDMQRRYEEHSSLTREREPSPALSRVIKNTSFFKLNERVKFNIRFISLNK